MPKREPFSPTERRILDAKANMSRISKERLLAYREGRTEEAASQQFRLLEAELRNVEVLSEYVRAVSPSAARELTGHVSVVASRFAQVRAAGDASTLQDWLKKELVPLVNKCEQAALLVAVASRQVKGEKPIPFAWRLRPEE